MVSSKVSPGVRATHVAWHMLCLWPQARHPARLLPSAVSAVLASSPSCIKLLGKSPGRPQPRLIIHGLTTCSAEPAFCNLRGFGWCLMLRAVGVFVGRCLALLLLRQAVHLGIFSAPTKAPLPFPSANGSAHTPRLSGNGCTPPFLVRDTVLSVYAACKQSVCLFLLPAHYLRRLA